MLIVSSTPRSPAGGRREEAGAPPTKRGSVCSQEKPADAFLRSRFDANEIRRVHAEGMGPTEIARQVGWQRITVYRALEGPKDEAMHC